MPRSESIRRPASGLRSTHRNKWLSTETFALVDAVGTYAERQSLIDCVAVKRAGLILMINVDQDDITCSTGHRRSIVPERIERTIRKSCNKTAGYSSNKRISN
jgi:hypothetical protein